MNPVPGDPVVDPKVRAAAKWVALTLFVLYCADLVWKLAHWNQYSAGLKISTFAIALTLRLLFMVFLLWVYLRARRTS